MQSNFIEIALRHGVLLLICCIFSEHLFLRTLLRFENYFPLKKTCKKSVTPWKVLSVPLKNVMNTSYLQTFSQGRFWLITALLFEVFFSDRSKEIPIRINLSEEENLSDYPFATIIIFFPIFQQMRLIDMHQRLCIS